MDKTQIELKGRVVLVTGASSGIGAVCAQYFASMGMKVVLAARRADKLEEVVAKIKSEVVGAEAIAVCGSIANEEDQKRFYSEAQKAFGEPVSMVLANAGIGKLDDPITGEFSAIREVYETNVLGSFLSLRESVKAMREAVSCGGRNFGGSIVFISTAGAVFNNERLKDVQNPAIAQVYISSKLALTGLVKTAAIQYAPEKIRIYGLLPFVYASRGQPELAPGTVDEFAKINPIFPENRGSPLDIARIVWHLFENSSGFAPGENILSDHDATFSSSLYSSILESPVRDPVFLPGQIRDASGQLPYNFSIRPSSTVSFSSSSSS